jgi:tetratricopeptide (TPR) repeat protein
MKKYIFILLSALVIVSCDQKQVSNNDNDGKIDNKPAKLEVTTSDQAEQNKKEGIIVTQNQSPGSPSMMTQEDNERVKAAYGNAIEYYQQGKLKEAADQFDIVLQFYPENPRALYYMGKIYYDLNDYDLSLSYYEKALGNNINDSLSTLAIGMIYYQEKNMEKAMEYYNMAIEGFPNYGLAYYNRGTLYGQQNRYNLSLADLNKSIELDKTNPNAYLNRGLAYYYLKQMDNACKDWNKAADMGLAEGKKAVDIYCKK